jgi:hypothetical protein
MTGPDDTGAARRHTPRCPPWRRVFALSERAGSVTLRAAPRKGIAPHPYPAGRGQRTSRRKQQKAKEITMSRSLPFPKTVPALGLALGIALAAGNAFAQAPSTQGPAPMQPGQRMATGAAVGERTVRQVMISQGGGGLTIVYDMAPGETQSQRVLRLENVNGMLEVIYDNSVPTMATASGGTPRLVQRGGGMYSVEYDR